VEPDDDTGQAGVTQLHEEAVFEVGQVAEMVTEVWVLSEVTHVTAAGAVPEQAQGVVPVQNGVQAHVDDWGAPTVPEL